MCVECYFGKEVVVVEVHVDLCSFFECVVGCVGFYVCECCCDGDVVGELQCYVVLGVCVQVECVGGVWFEHDDVLFDVDV